MQRVLITGGSGLIGRRLTHWLIEKNYQVSWLTRYPNHAKGIKQYKWDIQKKDIDPQAIIQTDCIIHLAGAGVADKPWTPKRKQEILESRTHSTALLAKALRENAHQVRTFIAASAIGFYGMDTGQGLLTENTPAGQDFLARVVQAWEAETDLIDQLGIRVVKFRIGIVLSKEGGALPKLLQPIQFYIGAPLGSGKQWMSWIHIDDLCRLFIWAMENPTIKGTYNAVAPFPVTNEEMVKTAANMLHRPVLPFNVPAFALKIVFGQMASMLLGGSKVSSAKIEQSGFVFSYPTLGKALRELLSGQEQKGRS
ncbi:MAG: TIGR01777 family oxidoreductase [Cytophagales bacterium]|nr:TIGR01777 family oxidoreductase [Bernardetiaceae bacterium]MDW8209565.1 TIGR01777 family oxidoreductase [Cytophagales bacterium]